MDKGTIKTQNPKCRLHWCLVEFIDWRYSQSCWYFRPLLWPVAPLSSLWPPPPLPPPQSKRTVCGSGGGRGGCVSCFVDHILQEFNALFLTRFRITKLLHHPIQKWPVKTTFRDWCLWSSVLHGLTQLLAVHFFLELCVLSRLLAHKVMYNSECFYFRFLSIKSSLE